MYYEGIGSIFDSTADAYVNPVNCLGVSGAGLAKEFVSRFPQNQTLLKEAAKKNMVCLGRVHLVNLPPGLHEPFWIINFPTKQHWKDKSELWLIEMGLLDLEKKIKSYSIPSIAFPALGCGLGGLDWVDVNHLLWSFAKRLPDVAVTVYRPK